MDSSAEEIWYASINQLLKEDDDDNKYMPDLYSKNESAIKKTNNMYQQLNSNIITCQNCHNNEINTKKN